MHTITHDWLISHNACARGMRWFGHYCPSGKAIITPEFLHALAKEDPSWVQWLAQRLLSPPTWAEYLASVSKLRDEADLTYDAMVSKCPMSRRLAIPGPHDGPATRGETNALHDHARLVDQVRRLR